ncbi:hypothetical protein T01_14181 [Trichinella spiralis]|uniref:Uncharacterized protein n=1 Tax=Trichinella spiralis TaxID=6334 RepID=A0A0V1BC97_TRISP|nr:hypothetical protein T01_14181 [Trichinella spiralis]
MNPVQMVQKATMKKIFKFSGIPISRVLIDLCSAKTIGGPIVSRGFILGPTRTFVIIDSSSRSLERANPFDMGSISYEHDELSGGSKPHASKDGNRHPAGFGGIGELNTLDM